MPLEMREKCERCETGLDWSAEAHICSYECTFCRDCSDGMNHICPNCCSGRNALSAKLPDISRAAP
jgi:hypothetical protein